MPAPNSKQSTGGLNGPDTEREIRRVVQSVEIGEKLPSIRDFRRRFEVGQAVVERVLNQLKDEGLITVRPKSGSFRSEPHTLPINLVYRHNPSDLERRGYYNDFMSQLITAMAGNGHAVRLHAAADRDALVEVLDKCRNTSSRLMTFGMNWKDLDLTQNRSQVQFTAVHVLPNFVEEVPASLVMDDQEIMRLTLDHLHERGHRRIAYFHRYSDQFWSRAEHTRHLAFHEHATRLGIQPQPQGLQFVGREREFLDRAFGLAFSDPRPPSAIVMGDENQIKSVYRNLRERRLEPGRDVAVIGVNDSVWCEFVEPELSSIRISTAQGARLVARILDQLEAGEDPGIHYLEPELIVRASSDFDAS